MIGRRLASAAFAASTIAMLTSVGCSSASAEDVGASEAAVTPADPETPYQQAELCGRNMKRHQSVKALDLQQGVIRWGCGDVPGVTDSDLGQEYCEYQAVQNGGITRKAAEIVPGAPMSCVFTSVFTESGQAGTLKPALAAAANLGAAVRADAIVQMQKGFNTKDAATTLLSDCTAAGTPELTLRLRTTACYQAFTKGGPNAAALAPLCKEGNLMIASTWAKAQQLGAAIATPDDPAYEAQRDISGCMAVSRAGIGWRNSDPMICSRVARSSSECSCAFNEVPSSLKGIPFTGWVNDQLPSGCRFAKVNGADYPFIAICDVSAQEVADLPLNPAYARNIGNFCHDRFAVDLVMKFPLRALQTAATCTKTADFCSDYMGDAPGEPVPAPGAGELTPTTGGRKVGAPPSPALP